MHQGEQPSRTDAFFEALALNGCLAHHDGWMLWTGALRTTTGGWLTLPEEAACEDQTWTLLVAPCHKSMDTFGGPLSQKLGHFWWPLVTKAWTLFVDECQADGCLGQHHDLCSCTTRGSVGHLTRLCCGSSTTQDRLGVTLLCGFFWAANYHHLQQ